MRNMSYALTEEQVLARLKWVTRRLGWLHLKEGDLVQPVRKGMGLRPGEKIVRLGGPIRIIDVRREPLRMMTDDLRYGLEETTLEGFPEPHPKHAPGEFVAMFCATHRGCTPDTIITRIAFAYT